MPGGGRPRAHLLYGQGLRQAKRLAERGWAGTVGGKQPPIGLSLVAMSRLVPPAAASRAIWVSCGVSCGPFGPARSIACSPVAAPVIRLPVGGDSPERGETRRQG